MDWTGWVFMGISVGTVLSLTVFCFLKVWNLPPSEEEDLHGPLDIDTHEQA